MRKEFLEEVRADIDRLEELRHRIEELHERAIDDLNALETAEAEDDGTESAYLRAISISIRQAIDECAEFDEYFSKTYGAKEEGEA